MSIIKPRHAKWLMEAFSDLSKQKNLALKAFKKAGLLQCFGKDAVDEEDQSESSDEEDELISI